MTKKQTEERWPEPVYLTADHAINMSLRDYFAAKAMQGLMGRDWSNHTGTDQELIDLWARSAYGVADAMLKARGNT